LRWIDHLVLPSKEIEAQVTFYSQLGFRVGARNIHPWGTENHIVQFKNSFLELITLGDRATPPPHGHRNFSFGRHVQNWLATKGDGMSMLVLTSNDARADAKAFAGAGIGDFEPFHFQRKGKRSDGSETEVAFTLAFSECAEMREQSFFVCQQHFPENFWNLAMQVHENTVTAIRSVVIVHPEPKDCLDFFETYSGGMPKSDNRGGFSIATEHGDIAVMMPNAAQAAFGDDALFLQSPEGRFASIVFEVSDIEKTKEIICKNSIPNQMIKNRIVIPSSAAIGIVLVFEQGSPT
jgi:catechol 2,3-dioxygenase-like lactoylglutathione lyase family enzyme